MKVNRVKHSKRVASLTHLNTILPGGLYLWGQGVKLSRILRVTFAEERDVLAVSEMLITYQSFQLLFASTETCEREINHFFSN